MKKSLLRLPVMVVAFGCGVFAVGVFNFKKEIVSNSAVKESKPVELRLTKVEPLKPITKVEDLKIEAEMPGEPDNENLFDGWYGLDDFKGMSEVELISLSTEDGAHENSKKIILSGGVFTTLGRDADEGFFSTASAQINNNKVKFRTRKIKGIEYRFEGTFFKNKTTGADGEKLLRGTLQKFVKGKKAAQIGGDFAYSEPRCWH